MDPSELLPATTYWWQLILALLIVIVGWILSRFARKGVLAVAHRAPGISESVALFAARFIAYAMVLLAIGIGLALLGANIQPLLAIVIILVVVLVLVRFTLQPVPRSDQVKQDVARHVTTQEVADLRAGCPQ